MIENKGLCLQGGTVSPKTNRTGSDLSDSTPGAVSAHAKALRLEDGGCGVNKMNAEGAEQPEK